MKIGVLIAMDKEFQQFIKLLNNKSEIELDNQKYHTGTIGNNSIVAKQCGIGKVNAAMTTANIIQLFHPDVIVSTGVAGGASTDINVQDVVVSAETCYHDVYCGNECKYGQVMGLPLNFACSEMMVKKAINIDCGVTIHKGLIVTGDWFVDSKEKMRDILNHFPNAMAVDMESCAIAHICYKKNTPFVSFRVISDIPLKENNIEQYNNFWEVMADNSFHVTKSFFEAL